MDKTPTNDAELKTALNELFKDWREALEDTFGEDFKDNKFVEDGAFPGYFNQPLKILFVGWEAYGCEGLWKTEEGCPCDYWNNYQREKRQYPCEGRKLMNFFLAGKDACEGQKRPSTAQLAAKITYELLKLYDADKDKKTPEHPKCPEDMSFAFMDVSKFVNNTGSGLSEGFRKYVDESLCENKSKRNFIRDEIDLLNPDLIISWNLRAKLGVKRFNKLLTGNHKQDPKKISCNFLSDRAWTYTFNKRRDASTGEIKQIPLLDSWHFSSATERHKKDAKRDIYNPIWKAVEALVEDGILKPKQG